MTTTAVEAGPLPITTRWTCSSCRHTWKDHCLAKTCPNCRGHKILGEALEPKEGPEARKARFACPRCAHDWRSSRDPGHCPKCCCLVVEKLGWVFDRQAYGFLCAASREDNGQSQEGFWDGPGIGGPWWRCATCDHFFRALGRPQECPRHQCGGKSIDMAGLVDELPESAVEEPEPAEEPAKPAGRDERLYGRRRAGMPAYVLCGGCGQRYDPQYAECPICEPEAAAAAANQQGGEPMPTRTGKQVVAAGERLNAKEQSKGRGRGGKEPLPDFAAREAALSPAALVTVELREIAVVDVVESPFNQRDWTIGSGADLTSLTASVRENGVLQPVLVRLRSSAAKGLKPKTATWELIAGARRLRAAKAAGRETIPAKIVTATDQQAIEWNARENFDRESLGPIERARTIKQMLDSGIEKSQEALAKRLGISQASVSDAVRLVTLPEDWQARITEGKLTETQGRDLAPYAACPTVLECLGKYVDRRKSLYNTREFAWAIEQALRKVGRVMDEPSYEGDDGRQFRTTKEQDKALHVVKYDGESFALNVGLYDELQAAAVKRNLEREAKREKSAGADDKGRSPEEQKEAAKAKREQWAKRLYRWKVGWLQRLVVARLRAMAETALEDPDEQALLFRLALFSTVEGDSNAKDDPLHTACKAAGVKVRGASYSPDWFRTLAGVDEEQLCRVMAHAAAELVALNFESYHVPFRAEHIEALATELKIDLKKEWKSIDLKTDPYLGLHTTAQLRVLGKEWGKDIPEAATKAGAVGLITMAAPKTVPREVLEAKAELKDLVGHVLPLRTVPVRLP